MKRMTRLTALLLCLLLTVPALCETAATETIPAFLTPAVFVERFNATIPALADKFSDALGEEGVDLIKNNYVFTQKDPQNALLYIGNGDWSLEAGFLYADAASVDENTPALVLNLNIKNDVPEVVAYFAKFTLQMMIEYDFQDEVSPEDLANWFETAEDSADIFTLPGYTLSVLKTDDHIQYIVLPPAEKIPQMNDAQP